MAFFEVPGAKIFYEFWQPSSQQSRGWVTLVNGHTRTSSDFRILGRRLTDLGWKVLALDNRGSGQTQTNGPFTLADMANDIVALWREVGCDKSELLGISMGGVIAQILAAQVPSLVNHLILISTYAESQWLIAPSEPWLADFQAIDAKLSRFFAPDFVRRNKVLVQAMVKQIYKSMVDGRFNANADAQRAALDEIDTRSLLARIVAPSLIIHGDEDRVISVEAARYLATHIPHARLVVLKGAGHLLLAERPQEVYGLVSEFFDGVM